MDYHLVDKVVLLLGLEGALAGQILSYNEGQHSRSEVGEPGTNVTGKWSWVDNQGDQHHIWYVADAGGFRAFGDLVPETPQRPKLIIGTPVIGGTVRTSTLNADNLGIGIPGRLLERIPLSVGTPVLGGPRRTLDSVSGNQFPTGLAREIPSPANHPSVHLGKDALGFNIKSVTSSPLTATPSNAFDSATPLPLPTLLRGSHHASQQATQQSIFVLQPGIESIQGAFTNSVNGQMEKLLTQGQVNKQENSGILIDIDSKRTLAKPVSGVTVENAVPETIIGKAIATFPSPKENKQTSQASSDDHKRNRARELSLEMLLPAPAAGSDFVLIDRLRVPNAPKPRVGSPKIVPQPVNVQSPSSQVIMGLHTSGRAPVSHRAPQPTRDLEPLGIHLLNLVPFRATRKNPSANGPVPRPMRVIGAPNLENFYRPATLARTTPSPFRLPNPIRDYDYQYYDYDYYDYEYETGGGPKKIDDAGNKSATDGSDESETSAEPDFLDSDENDD